VIKIQNNCGQEADVAFAAKEELVKQLTRGDTLSSVKLLET
jgi:hypothetical protein